MNDFLSLVLPPEGNGSYAAWDGKTKAHIFCATIDELAAALARIDQSGGTAYFATATFTEPRRLAEKVQAKRAFYLDIDFKNIDSLDPFKVVIDHLRAFSKTHGLGAPTYIVSTGGGVHVYWALDTDVAPVLWKSYAEGFKAAVMAAGIPADHGITADAARVLRPVGTLNHKYDPPYRTEGRLTGKVFPLSAFDCFLSGHSVRSKPELASLELPEAPRYRPFWMKSVVESGSCRLVNWALQPESQQRDNMSEGLWTDLLATCSKAEDGVHYAHEFSKHDADRYGDGSAVDQKLAAWRGQQHPRTCVTMAAHGKCGSCPNVLSASSPIRFGYTPPEQVVPGTTDPSAVIGEMLKQQLRVFYPGEDADFLDRYKPMVKWPFGFGFDPVKFRTVHVEEIEEQDEEGNLIRRRVTTPLWAGVFWPQHKMRNEQGVMLYEFVFWARLDEHPVRVVVDPNLYGAETNTVNLLTRYGFPLTLNFKKLATTYFARCLDLINELTKDSRTSDTLGWDETRSFFNFGHAYACMEGGSVEVRSALLSHRISMYGLNMSCKGDLAAWKDAISTYEGEGRERYQFGLLAGFASVLIPFTAQKWSHLLHVFSDASGSGKTSLQQAIWSIWGEPVIDKGRSTYNALVDKFSVYGCLPGVIDEITLFESDALRRLALDVAAGEPRARLLQTGQRVVHGKSWQLIGVSSANVDIEYEIGKTGNAEGEIARITSIELPTGRLNFDNHARFQQIQSNYGLAGRLFVTALMEHGLNKLRGEIREVESALVDKFKPSETLRSALRFKFATFACILVALRITNKCGLTNFDERDMHGVIEELIESSIERIGNPSNNIISDIRSFISTNNSFLPRLFRDERGDLSMANRMDGMLSRSMSRVGNGAAANRTDAFIVVNDWPHRNVPAIHGTQPALYVSRVQLDNGKRRLFPSVRTDPVKTVPARLEHTGYSMDIVSEFVLGVRTEFVRVLMPPDVVDAAEIAAITLKKPEQPTERSA